MTRYCDCLHGIMLERDDLRHAAEAEANALDEVQRVNREKRDALQAKLDKAREIAGRGYFSAECRAAMNEVLDVLNGR